MCRCSVMAKCCAVLRFLSSNGSMVASMAAAGATARAPEGPMDEKLPTVDRAQRVDPIPAPTVGDTAVAVALERLGSKPIVRIGLLGLAAAALVAVAILAAGATALPGNLFAAGAGNGTTDSSSTGSSTTDPGFALSGGPGLFADDKLFGELGAGVPGHLGGHLLGGIPITAISGNDISLQTEDGWTRTITVDSGTKYLKGGDEIAL